MMAQRTLPASMADPADPVKISPATTRTPSPTTAVVTPVTVAVTAPVTTAATTPPARPSTRPATLLARATSTATTRRDCTARLLRGASALVAVPGWLALASAPASAAVGGLPAQAAHTDTSPQWEQLRPKIFQDRPIRTVDSLVQLIVPLRAAYGASVPVKIVSRLPQTAERHVRRMVLLVDKNPSVVAAVLDLTPELGQADFETRLRVDEYSHIRVVAELSTGELHMASRYVKTSGGCSAPPNRSAPELIGRTVLRLPEGARLNEPTVADVTVLHPNDTGFELNNVTVMRIPPHFVRSIKVSYGGARLFDAELDFSISENPTFRFNFVPRGEGRLRADVEDSKEGRFSGHLDVRGAA